MLPKTRDAYLNRNTKDSVLLFSRVIFWHATFYAFNILQLPFLLLIEGVNVTKSFGFWWWTSYMDHMFSMSLIINTGMYFVYSEEFRLPHTLNFILLYTIIFRCFKISSRYMYMSPTKYK